MSQLTPQAAAALLRDQDNLLILTHRRPDGDTTPGGDEDIGFQPRRRRVPRQG